jgi:cobalt-precorrin 5A hydrolase/precorrin-3B C17-methyltransferase
LIALVTATAAGRALAGRLAAAWPDETVACAGPVGEQVRAAWAGSDALVCFLAAGATIRLVAPLLGDKQTDPAVVCVDESGGFAVALLGGHHGANELADRVAGVLGAQPVVTTATDAARVTPLDTYGVDLGFRLADRSPVARVTAAVLDGAPVRLESDQTWPVPALPVAPSIDGGLSSPADSVDPGLDSPP